MKKFLSGAPSLSPRSAPMSRATPTRAPRKSFCSAMADSSTSLPIEYTVSMASTSSLNLRRAISVRSRCMRSWSEMMRMCSLSRFSSVRALVSSRSTSMRTLCSSRRARCSFDSCTSSRPASSSCRFRSSSTYSLRSRSFSFMRESSSVMSVSRDCTGMSRPTASLLTCSARRHASCSAVTSLWCAVRISSISFSRRADAPRSSCSTRFTLSTSSAISFSSASACLSCCLRSTSSLSYRRDASRRARYSGLPRMSSTSNLAMTVFPTSSVSASTPASTARAKVRTTKLPSCPRRRLLSTLTGSPITSRPSTPQMTSPTRTRPSLSAEPPLTMVLTYTLPSGSCWKKMPTPLMPGPAPVGWIDRESTESFDRTLE
mmetsp:Transcript_68062/g.168164  ORF Transcript_68062/g.168164 Transcript_68062/m.168164 type:complete len:374 (-) Transcript_68062:200-1321(-)